MVALATQRNHARLLGPAPSGGRLDVLVDPEQIGRIIFALHGRQPGIVCPVGRLEPGVALIVHHEIRIGAAEVERMHRLPIGLGPSRDGEAR
jgi:hypothetical protein